MQKYGYVEEFKIKYCDVDYKDEIKLSSVLAYLEEAACESGEELGFGYGYIKPRGYAFVISSICCELFAPMKLGERVNVVTWPTPPSHAIFGREYQIKSQDNTKTLLKCTSRWCLIDVREGKIVSSKAIDNQDYSTYNTDRALEWTDWKIPQFSIDEGELGFSLKIANSEYDHNLHVNNTKYADYCLNCFSIAELDLLSLKRFQISYHKQCREGDELRFYRKQTPCANETGEKEYVVWGVNQFNERVTSARLTFIAAEDARKNE